MRRPLTTGLIERDIGPCLGPSRPTGETTGGVAFSLSNDGPRPVSTGGPKPRVSLVGVLLLGPLFGDMIPFARGGGACCWGGGPEGACAIEARGSRDPPPGGEGPFAMLISWPRAPCPGPGPGPGPIAGPRNPPAILSREPLNFRLRPSGVPFGPLAPRLGGPIPLSWLGLRFPGTRSPAGVFCIC